MFGATHTFTRYTAVPADAVWSSFEHHGFDRIPSPSAVVQKKVVHGWCDPENARLPPKSSACCVEPYWRIGLRVDTWAVPARTMKDVLGLKKRAWLADSGRERVPRPVVDEMKESIFLEHARPTTKHIPVIWDLQTGDLYLSTSNKDARAMFESLWMQSQPRSSLARVDQESFALPRMLLWLWYRTEHGDVHADVDGESWEFWIEGQMEFSSDAASTRVKAEKTPGTQRPAYAALAAGYLPSRLRLGMKDVSLHAEASVLLEPPAAQIRSLKLTAPELELQLQITRIQRVLAFLDAMTREFASIVSDPSALDELEGRLTRWKNDWNRTLSPETP